VDHRAWLGLPAPERRWCDRCGDPRPAETDRRPEEGARAVCRHKGKRPVTSVSHRGGKLENVRTIERGQPMGARRAGRSQVPDGPLQRRCGIRGQEPVSQRSPDGVAPGPPGASGATDQSVPAPPCSRKGRPVGAPLHASRTRRDNERRPPRSRDGPRFGSRLPRASPGVTGSPGRRRGDHARRCRSGRSGASSSGSCHRPGRTARHVPGVGCSAPGRQ
jgi:hypothetical protein